MKPHRVFSIVLVAATLVLSMARASSGQTSNALPVHTPGRPIADQTGFDVGIDVGGARHRVPEDSVTGDDDPGLVGAVIGAPVGATAGGILGDKFLL
jgi:hypothetical protein